MEKKEKENKYNYLVDSIYSTVVITLFSSLFSVWEAIGLGLKPGGEWDYYSIIFYAIISILLILCLIFLKKKKEYAGAFGLIASAVLLGVGEGYQIWLGCINIAACTLYLAPFVYPSLKKDIE